MLTFVVDKKEVPSFHFCSFLNEHIRFNVMTIQFKMMSHNRFYYIMLKQIVNTLFQCFSPFYLCSQGVDMATVGSFLSEDQFRCCICLDVFTPFLATLPALYPPSAPPCVPPHSLLPRSSLALKESQPVVRMMYPSNSDILPIQHQDEPNLIFG